VHSQEALVGFRVDEAGNVTAFAKKEIPDNTVLVGSAARLEIVSSPLTDPTKGLITLPNWRTSRVLKPFRV
jgi:hypothetical protein